MSAQNPGIAHAETLRWWQKWYPRHPRHPFFVVYTAFIALGVPLMGYLTGGFTVPFADVFVDAFELKLVIAAIWFAISHRFWMIHLEEIDMQMEKFGELGVMQSDQQRASVYHLYFAVIIAVCIWLIFAVLYLVTFRFRPPALWAGPSYGVVEVSLLAHTLWVSRAAQKLVWPLISTIQQAVASQLRREQPTATR